MAPRFERLLSSRIGSVAGGLREPARVYPNDMYRRVLGRRILVALARVDMEESQRQTVKAITEGEMKTTILDEDGVLALHDKGLLSLSVMVYGNEDSPGWTDIRTTTVYREPWEEPGIPVRYRVTEYYVGLPNERPKSDTRNLFTLSAIMTEGRHDFTRWGLCQVSHASDSLPQ